MLYRAAYRLSRSAVDAEDLVQEVCVRAYPRIGDIEQLEHPRGWLLRVMYRIFVDQRRRYDRKHVRAIEEDEEFVSGEPGPAEEAERALSYWQGVYEAPPPAPPEAIRRDDAESLLRKLIEAKEVKFTAAAYILAVMLERKRQLKIKEQFQREGRRVFIYEQPRTGDIFTITDPDLQLDQLDAVQHQVAQLLEHGLNPPAASGVAAADPSPAGVPATDGLAAAHN